VRTEILIFQLVHRSKTYHHSSQKRKTLLNGRCHNPDERKLLTNTMPNFQKRRTQLTFTSVFALRLLHPSSGLVKNGQICGIIGPSGSGKSTLLSALGGTIKSESGKNVHGVVWIDELVDSLKDDEKKCGGRKGKESETNNLLNSSLNKFGNDSKKQIVKKFLSARNGEVANLQQHDNFFSMLTPRETIDLAAYLQLVDLNKEDRKILVESLLDSLGLRHIATRTIGDSGDSSSSGSLGLTSGSNGCLSGGERRRLSVALELVTSPKVFLADEPTTGLDSAQAQKVVDRMVKLAREHNIPCICSLHQPRTSIWKTLDSIILLAPGGKVIYVGECSDAVSYFKKLGYSCPVEINPLEFFIDLVTVDTETHDKNIEDYARIEFLHNSFCEFSSSHLYSSVNGDMVPPLNKIKNKNLSLIRGRSFFKRLGALYLRSLRQNLRDSRVNLMRIIASVSLGRLFSQLFKSVKDGVPLARSVADRVALLSFAVINMTMLSLSKTLNLFGKEKPVISREQHRQQYHCIEYLLSKIMAEIPLDIMFSSIFACTLKCFTNLRTPTRVLTSIFSIMTLASASFGFAIGSMTNGVEEAMTVGLSTMVILMAVGVINPSGVDKNQKDSLIVEILKTISPIKLSIEALCVSEFKGMDFNEGRSGWNLRDLPKMGGLSLVKNGDQVLDALGIGDKNYIFFIGRLSILSGVNFLISWIGLMRRSRFI